MKEQNNIVTCWCVLDVIDAWKFNTASYILIGTDECHLCIYKYDKTEYCTWILQAHQGAVSWISASNHDRESFFSSGYDKIIKLWNLNNLKCVVCKYRGHESEVTYVSDLSKNGLVASASLNTILVHARFGDLLWKLVDADCAIQNICTYNKDDLSDNNYNNGVVARDQEKEESEKEKKEVNEKQKISSDANDFSNINDHAKNDEIDEFADFDYECADYDTTVSINSDGSDEIQTFEDQPWTHIFAIEVGDHPAIGMPYESHQDPTEVALKFIEDNQLDKIYLKQITDRIVQFKEKVLSIKRVVKKKKNRISNLFQKTFLT